VIDGSPFCVPNVGRQIVMFFEDGKTLDGNELIVLQAGQNNKGFDAKSAAKDMGDHIGVLATGGDSCTA
jgi:hypothetical protein